LASAIAHGQAGSHRFADRIRSLARSFFPNLKILPSPCSTTVKRRPNFRLNNLQAYFLFQFIPLTRPCKRQTTIPKPRAITSSPRQSATRPSMVVVSMHWSKWRQHLASVKRVLAFCRRAAVRGHTAPQPDGNSNDEKIRLNSPVSPSCSTFWRRYHYDKILRYLSITPAGVAFFWFAAVSRIVLNLRSAEYNEGEVGRCGPPQGQS
jgi:hypothetical protein